MIVTSRCGTDYYPWGWGSIPALAQWVKGPSIVRSCGVGCKRGSDLALLWLWCRLAAAAPIWPLAWEPPHAMGEAIKRQKKKKKAYIISKMYFESLSKGERKRTIVKKKKKKKRVLSLGKGKIWCICVLPPCFYYFVYIFSLLG